MAAARGDDAPPREAPPRSERSGQGSVASVLAEALVRIGLLVLLAGLMFTDASNRRFDADLRDFTGVDT